MQRLGRTDRFPRRQSPVRRGHHSEAANLLQRAATGDTVGLVADCERIGETVPLVSLIGAAVHLSVNDVRRDYRQLPLQLVGRLGGPADYQKKDLFDGYKGYCKQELLDFLTRLEQHNYGFHWYCPLSEAWDQADPDQPCTLVLERSYDFVNDIAFSPSGCELAGGFRDGLFRLWDSKTGEYQEFRKFVSDQILSVDFSPDGTSQ